MNDRDDALAAGQRIYLRRFRAADAARCLEILSNDELLRYLSITKPKTIDDAEAYLEKNYLSRYREADKGVRNENGLPVDLRLAICLKEADGPGALIGRVGIASTGDTNNVGYYLSRESWGKGYACEACEVLLGLARRAEYSYLTAFCDEGNAGSEQTMKRAGFTYRYSWRSEERANPAIYHLYQIDLVDGVQTFLGHWNANPGHWIDGKRLSGFTTQ